MYYVVFTIDVATIIPSPVTFFAAASEREKRAKRRVRMVVRCAI
jgi:hypothetical protein